MQFPLAASLFLCLLPAPSSASWLDVCSRCDLPAIEALDPEVILCKGVDDESCLTLCLASPRASVAEKTAVLDWLLLEQAVPVDNEVFEQVCRNAVSLRHQDPTGWEHFPLALLTHPSSTPAGFDYEEALCHAALHGCQRTAEALLLGWVEQVNWEKILPESLWLGQREGERAEQEIRFLPTTPLIQAVMGGSLGVVEMLVRHGWSAVETQAGLSPVMLAVRHEARDIAAFLIRLGAAIEHGVLAQASHPMQGAVLGAIAYRKRLVEAAESRIRFYSEPVMGSGEAVGEGVFEALPRATRVFIEEQLAGLGYTDLEIHSVLHPHHSLHF